MLETLPQLRMGRNFRIHCILFGRTAH